MEAEEINVSQSSLSQQVNKLESELGVRLFDRTTRKVKLTPAGVDFVRHAINVLQEIDDATRTIQEYLTVERGHIDLGVFPPLGSFQLTSLIADFQKTFPGVKFSFYEAECEELVDMLVNAKINLAFLSEIEGAPVEFYNLLVDEVGLIVNFFHPLAVQQSVSLAQLADENFIIPTPTSGIYKNFLAACNDAGFNPKILYCCNQIDTNVGFVEANMGIGVLSYQTALRHANEVKVLRVVPPLTRKISLASPKNASISPAVGVFIKFAMQWVASRTEKS
jgi:LysR family transcriptional activator of glutamate synthase operon